MTQADAQELVPGRRHRARQPRKGDETETAILESAWSLVTSKPFSQVTISAVAAGAGISRPTFYFYFGSKDEMAHALADRIADEIRQTTGALFGPSDGQPRASIRSGVAAYMARWREKGAVLRAMAPLAEADESLRSFWDDVSDRLLAEIAAAIDEERLAGRALPAPPASHDLAKAFVAMLWRSGYELSMRPADTAEEERLVDTLSTVIMRSLYGDAGPG